MSDNADSAIRGVDWCGPNPTCINDGGQFELQGNDYVLSEAVDSPLTSLGSTPSPPLGSRKRGVTAWVRSLAETIRVHARAWG